MLRVMFVTASLSHGGAERSSITLMNRLSDRGHECHAVHVKAAAEQLGRLRIRGEGTVRSLNVTRRFEARAVADLAAHISRIKPSVIVAVNPYALMYAWLALRVARVRARLVVAYHSNRLLDAKEWVQMLLYRLFFWTSDCAVFVCEKQRQYWLRKGVLSQRNVVIYNGVDTEEFRDSWSPEERRRFRASLGFSDEDFVVGISALLRPEKNHLQLVEAIALLRSRGVAARALMIGDGPMRAAIEARARSLAVGGDVVITGFQQDVRPHLAASDAVALCSFTEAFSVAAIEAMAMGRPVVHSDVGGASEMIMPGQNGLLFPAGNTALLVDKLAILANRAASSEMGRAARTVATRLFSEETMVDRYEQTLRHLCKQLSGEAVRPDHHNHAKSTWSDPTIP